MSDASSDSSTTENKDLTPTLILANTIGLGVILLITLVSLILIALLSRDVAHLEDQLRKSVRAVKALEQQIAQLNESAIPEPARPATPKPPSPPVPGNIDAADPANDCVIRPGAKGGLAHCL